MVAAATDAVTKPPYLKFPAQGLAVVAAVGQKHRIAVRRQPARTRDVFHQPDDETAFIQVPGRYLNSKRYPARVTDQMDFAGRFAPVDRARPRLGAPFFAGTVVASTINLRVSSTPASSTSANTTSSTCSHTPARVHSSNLRQHVWPLGRPSRRGNAGQGTPNRQTSTIPSRQSRSG